MNARQRVASAITIGIDCANLAHDPDCYLADVTVDINLDALADMVVDVVPQPTRKLQPVLLTQPCDIDGNCDAMATAALALVNRSDCCGGYYGKQATTHKDCHLDWLPMREAMEQHFAGNRIIGLHTTSRANTCRWVAFDLDAHGGENERDNLAVASIIAGRLEQHGLDPYIFSSDGRGGIHVWAVFDSEQPADEAYDLARRVADGLIAEAFPKQPGVEPGRYGNWIRLPGRHYKREHWSEVRTNGQWGTMQQTADAFVAMCNVLPPASSKSSGPS